MTNRKEIDDGAERIHIREIVGERLKCVGEKKLTVILYLRNSNVRIIK